MATAEVIAFLVDRKIFPTGTDFARQGRVKKVFDWLSQFHSTPDGESLPTSGFVKETKEVCQATENVVFGPATFPFFNGSRRVTANT